MAEDKQLTVAELLARARQDNPDAPEPGKRRRRRSIEEGGVTVAELTGSFKAVDAAPAQSRHSSVPMEDPEDPKLAAVQEREQQAEDEQKAPEQVEEEALEQETPEPEAAEQEAPEAEAGTPEVETPEVETEEPLPSEEDTGVIEKVETEDAAATGIMPTVEDEEPEFNRAAAFELNQPEEGGSTALSEVDEQAVDTQPESEEEEEGIGIGALIGLVVLGVIVGVIIFLGFQFLWARLAAWMVAIAAIVVTVALVFGVKALRTASDGVSMTLAGIVGLVVTFGPAALYYL